MISFLKRWWRERKREIDRESIWLHLRDYARDKEEAKAAFRMHMEMDHSTYGDMSEREKQDYIETFYWGRDNG